MKNLFISLFISFIAGSLYALTYPSFLGTGWFPLLFVALPLHLFSMERKATFKNSLFAITGFNLGLNLTGYYWIPHTLQEFGNLPYPAALVVSMLFTFILQPHWWFYALWVKFRPKFNWQGSLGVFSSAIILSFLERYIQQQFPSFVGAPWLHLAPYLGLAPIFGVIIFSFITYWVSLEAVHQIKNKKIKILPWVTLFIFTVINAALPLNNKPSDKTLKVRIVQANIGNFLKISSEWGDESSLSSIINSYLSLSTPPNNFQPDLIIWPETAYPNDFHQEQDILPRIFNEIMEETKAEMLIGGYIRNPDYTSHETVYNASILLSENTLKASYLKNILIPFGETLPFGPFNKKIVEYIPAVSLFARGNGGEKLETKEGYRFIAPICYEILESSFIRKLLNEHQDNQFIINLTNDSWYGDTAEPYQHLFLSKWRALEFSLPIIRSTNTGITSVIYPDGSESQRLLVGEKNTLEEIIPLPSPQNTIYQRYGVIPFLIFSIFLGLILWWQQRN